MSAHTEEERSLIKNAGDEEQVKKGRATKKLQEEQQRNALVAVLNTPEGRTVFWMLIEHCRVFKSVYDRDPIAMANLAARQDVGHYLMQLITGVEPEFLYLMQRENR